MKIYSFYKLNRSPLALEIFHATLQSFKNINVSRGELRL